jgi:phospholipase A-2-activating protein
LQTNELPLTYIDEVVRFIEKNTAGVNIGTAGNDYVDPYTGASRYQSNASSVPTPTNASTYADPYTGASRYSGGAPTQSSAPTPQPISTPRILPVTKFLAFKQANVAAMQGKLHQFDDALRHEISTSSLAMYPDEIKAVDTCFSSLAQIVATPPRPPLNKLTGAHVEAIIQILDRWPSSQRFPGGWSFS